ncbi:unnamed protein product [Cunninghamella echinulata]
MDHLILRSHIFRNNSFKNSFKRQNNDPILWFANPPINVPPQSNPPVHSIAYLNYKQKQQQQTSSSNQIK